jgi:hypothetical protein
VLRALLELLEHGSDVPLNVPVGTLGSERQLLFLLFALLVLLGLHAFLLDQAALLLTRGLDPQH